MAYSYILTLRDFQKAMDSLTTALFTVGVTTAVSSTANMLLCGVSRAAPLKCSQVLFRVSPKGITLEDSLLYNTVLLNPTQK